MIAPLRRRHRWYWIALCLLPAALAAALWSRPPAALFNSSLPTALRPPVANSATLAESTAESTVDIAGVTLHLALYSVGDETFLAIEPLTELAQPDVLAYWARVTTSSSLPPQAFMLGSVAGRRPQVFRLPAAARQYRGGQLVLFSLAHGEVLGSGALPRGPVPPAVEFSATSSALADDSKEHR